MDETFYVWNQRVRRAMDAIARCHGAMGLVIDCAHPYRLGWSPERTARALMKNDMADYRELHKAAIAQSNPQAHPEAEPVADKEEPKPVDEVAISRLCSRASETQLLNPADRECSPDVYVNPLAGELACHTWRLLTHCRAVEARLQATTNAIWQAISQLTGHPNPDVVDRIVLQLREAVSDGGPACP